jgi:hypothetical protein
MTRDTLQTVLRAAGGLAEKSGTFKASPEQRLTFYVGGDARGLALSQIEEVRLEELFVVIKTKELAQIFAEYTAVFAVSVQPPKEGAANRAGFA